MKPVRRAEGCDVRSGRCLLLALCGSLCAAILSGCRLDMFDQPKFEPLEKSELFENGAASRPIPEHTIPRGELRADELLYEGTVAGRLVDTFPFPITREILERGRQRFDIYCAVCHGLSGYGDGMIVQRGFPAPPSYHTERLRSAPLGHFFRVITHGYGAMYSYANRVEPADRWAIIAYIRTLQLSQHASLDAVPEGERERLEADRP